MTEVLSADECLAFLAEGGTGRVAVSAGALPAVYSVFFAFKDGCIVLRLGPNWHLHREIDRSVVAFSIDRFEADRSSGWSVLVQGLGEEVADPSLVESLLALPLPSWGDPPDADRFVRIRADKVAGTRFH